MFSHCVELFPHNELFPHITRDISIFVQFFFVRYSSMPGFCLQSKGFFTVFLACFMGKTNRPAKNFLAERGAKFNATLLPRPGFQVHGR